MMTLDPGGYTAKTIKRILTDATPTVVETIPIAPNSTAGAYVHVLARRTDSGIDAMRALNVAALSRAAGDSTDLMAGAGYLWIYNAIGTPPDAFPTVGNDGTGDLNECRIVMQGRASETWEFTVFIEVLETRDPT